MTEYISEAALLFLSAGILVELAAAISKHGIVRKALYLSSVGLTTTAVGFLVTNQISLFLFVTIYISGFRIFNAARLSGGKINQKRIVNVTHRTSMFLIFYQLVAVLLVKISDVYKITSSEWLIGFMTIGMLMSVVIFLATTRNLQKSSLKPSDNYTADVDLPTISVCIPARNESEELPACLESIIESDYPKLEILVLDDCSQDKTSEIIKGFASKGVRFISGDPPKSGWLAKNQAYQTLSEAASGDILIFCGVDIRINKKFLKTLVATMRARNKKMLSIMPIGAQKDPDAGVIQPSRYWWELALPRRLFNRPPVLSTFWAIEKDIYVKIGGMRAVSSMVVPEAYFAKRLTVTDSYGFMRSTGKLNIESTKTFQEQWNTAVRVKYPQLRKRPESVALILFVEVGMVIAPVWIFILGYLVPLGIVWNLAGISAVLLGWAYYKIISAYRKSNILVTLLLYPVALIVDVVAIIYSMYRYEFRSVIWKERDVCIPVMRTIPRLPKY